MRLRREDDRLNLTAELSVDMETGKKILEMTSQPKAGLGAEDFYGATLTITTNGTPSGFVTFTSVVIETRSAMTAIVASGLFMVAGNQTTTKAAHIVLSHMQSNDTVSESAQIFEIG